MKKHQKSHKGVGFIRRALSVTQAYPLVILIFILICFMLERLRPGMVEVDTLMLVAYIVCSVDTVMALILMLMGAFHRTNRWRGDIIAGITDVQKAQSVQHSRHNCRIEIIKFGAMTVVLVGIGLFLLFAGGRFRNNLSRVGVCVALFSATFFLCHMCDSVITFASYSSAWKKYRQAFDPHYIEVMMEGIDSIDDFDPFSKDDKLLTLIRQIHIDEMGRRIADVEISDELLEIEDIMMDELDDDSTYVKCRKDVQAQFAKLNDRFIMPEQDSLLYCMEITPKCGSDFFRPAVMVLDKAEDMDELGVHRAPAFVLEVAHYGEDRGNFFYRAKAYHAMGVKEYWILNPYSGEKAITRWLLPGETSIESRLRGHFSYLETFDMKEEEWENE